MSVRLRILLLVLSLVASSVVAVAWVVASTYGREKRSIERALGETSRALSLVVDRELGRREAVAWTLATSPSIRNGDREAFYAQAVEATASLGGWVVWFGPDGMIVNTSQQLQAELPRRREGQPRYVRTTESGATISDLFKGPASGRWLVAISVPVKQLPGHGVSIVVLPEHLQRTLDEQKLPAGWIATVFDREGRIVARQPHAQEWVGHDGPRALLERFGVGAEGLLNLEAVDGTAIAGFFSTSPMYRWAFLIGVPQGQMGASLRRSALQGAAIGLGLLVLSVAAAAVVGRSITRAARRLQGAAEAIKAGTPAVYTPTGVKEMDMAGATLADAGTQLIEANRRLQQTQEQLQRDLAERERAEQRRLAQIARMELLDQITRAIGDRLDLHSVFQVVANSVVMQTDVPLCLMAQHDAAAREIVVYAVAGRSRALAEKLGLLERARLSIEDNGLAPCLHGVLVHEPHLQHTKSTLAQRLFEAGLASAVFAPLHSEGRLFGVLLTAREAANAFTSGDCEFLRQLGEHVAVASRQAELHGDLQQAYDALRRTQQAVLEQERLRALGQMASGIAHDINNALSPVALYTESLLEQEPSISLRAREQLEIIRRSIDDVARTVARMREFYRPRSMEADHADVDLNVLVRQVLELTRARWRDMAQRTGAVIDVSTVLADVLPPVHVAEGEIREALTNLVFNAVDAMPHGGKLTLRTRRVEDADATSWIEVAVSDTGVGMDDATRRRCLEPFFTTKGERGTGLGLAMVYGTVQRHGGQMHIDSTPNVGTTVRLRFAPAGAPSQDTGWGELDARTLGPLNVLLVDDDPGLGRSLTEVLSSEGHRVTATTGGQHGIDAFAQALSRHEPFDVVITDLGMPHVDGRQVARAIKALSPGTPVIMLTGWGRRMNDEGERPPGVDQLLAKPPRLNELRAALQRAIGYSGS